MALSDKPLRFRPHHFLCTIGFEGKGYSPSFVSNFQEIADRLRSTSAGDSVPIRVVSHTDSICEPCPSKKGDLCETQPVITQLDESHSEILQISPGQELTWGEAKQRIKDRMTLEKFHSCCAPCNWKSLGVCEKALRALITAGMLLWVLVSPAKTSAAPSPSEWEQKSESMPLPWEELEQKLKVGEKTHRCPKGLTLALRAFTQQQYEKAISSAQPHTASAIWGDIAHTLLAQAHLALAEKKNQDKQFESALREAVAAEKEWNRIALEHPYAALTSKADTESGKAKATQGDALSHLHRYSEALKAFEVGFQKLLRNQNLGYLRLSQIEQFAKACKAAETFLCRSWVQKILLTEAKGSPEWNSLEALFPEQASNTKSSWTGTRLFQTYKGTSPDQTMLDEGFRHYLDKKYSVASKTFQTFLDEFPRSKLKARVRFWLAQSLSHLNEHKQAQSTYQALIQDSPLTFHAYASSMVTGIPLTGATSAVLPLAHAFEKNLTPSEQVRLKRAISLIQSQAPELAALELKEIRSRERVSSEFLYFLMNLSHRAGAHLTVFSVVSELIDRSSEHVYTTEALKMIFPIVEWPLIQKFSLEQQMDPVLILSLIKQESAFEPSAASSVGAQGLMQIMPATATETDSTVERARLAESETNIRVGTKYLKKMIDRFNGNIAFALASYNAGPNAVDRWIKEGRADRGLLEFIEQIPYSETQNYVGSIIKNYYWYSVALGTPLPQDLSLFWKTENAKAPSDR